MTRIFPASLCKAPIAHRALHDLRDGRPENSRAAARAAVAAGYGIEIDIQMSADGQAMVFHDYELSRLTPARGTVRSVSAETLGEVQLIGGDEGIPRLDEILEIVAGQVPLLIEIKDQDGALGPDVGELEAAVARALEGYHGDVALMSFNPHSVAALQTLLPDRPRGLTTEAFLEADEWKASRQHLAALERISDYERVGACFISHNHRQLAMPRVAELKADGAVVLCWTIRSPEDEAIARQIADNVTFEGYLP